MRTPEIGTTCPALTKENYKYDLSGDAARNCICALNDKPCIGRYIEDPEGLSSRFFSRGKCNIDTDKLKNCPVYGASKETFAQIIKDKAAAGLKEKLKGIAG